MIRLVFLFVEFLLKKRERKKQKEEYREKTLILKVKESCVHRGKN